MTLRPLAPDGSEDSTWDSVVAACPESGFMQSSAWARFKEAEGYLVHRLGLFDGETIVGGASLLAYPGPDGVLGMLLCPEGPVLPWDDTARARAGLKLIQAAAKELGGLGLRIEPHLPPPAPSLLRNWNRSPVDTVPLHTLVLDLTQPYDVLVAQQKPKCRYNFRLSERHGVSVRSSTSTTDLPTFYALFSETARRNQLYTEPYGFFLNLGATLFGSHATLYLAEWKEQTLAAILVLRFGTRATYLYGGSSRENRQVMPCYALHDRAIREAQAAGCTHYDFWGYDPFEQPNHLYAGISRFKTQFGGFRESLCGAHDLLFYDRLAEQLLTRLS